MMATVWIRLTLADRKYIVNGVEQKREDASEYFMFGPTGIVRFHASENITFLFSTGSTSVAGVEESPEQIMNILRKMRGTEGRLNGKSKEQKKKNSKGKTPRAKANRKA